MKSQFAGNLTIVLLAVSALSGQGQMQLHNAAEKVQWVKLSPQDGMVDSRRLDMDGGSLEVDVPPGKLDVGEDAVLSHIETAATAIGFWWYLFPTAEAARRVQRGAIGEGSRDSRAYASESTQRNRTWITTG